MPTLDSHDWPANPGAAGLSGATADLAHGRSNRRGANGAPQRRCIVTRRTAPKTDLIRFVVAPDGTLVADVDGRLPGRGLWVVAERDAIESARTGGLFAKAARRRVDVPADLLQTVEDQLRRRCIDGLAMARRAGQAVAGFEKVRAWLAAGKAAVVLTAHDGAVDGRGKLYRLCPDLPRVETLNAADLAVAFGRDHVVHAAMADGGLARGLLAQARRLAGIGIGHGDAGRPEGVAE